MEVFVEAKEKLGSLPQECPLPPFLRLGFSLAWSVSIRLDWWAIECGALPVCAVMSGSLHGCWGLNSDPHAWEASVLLTAPSPQVLKNRLRGILNKERGNQTLLRMLDLQSLLSHLALSRLLITGKTEGRERGRRKARKKGRRERGIGGRREGQKEWRKKIWISLDWNLIKCY